MKPGILPLTIYAGATFRQALTWSSGEPPEPVDLTGWRARMHVRARQPDAEPLLVLTTENARIVFTNAIEGRFALVLSAADTSAIPWKTGVYDLEMVAPDGTVRRLLQGGVTVSPEVTR